MNVLNILRVTTSRCCPSFLKPGAVALPIVLSRNKSYLASGLPLSEENYTQVEKSYEEWKYVEKLLPPKYVPEPPKELSSEYPSGWTPPDPERYSKFPYFIRRTKNGMVPVYYRSRDRSQIQFTRIRYVEGNIWHLEREIGYYLKKKYPEKTIITRVDEVCRYVHIRGDHEAEVKQWVLDQGF